MHDVVSDRPGWRTTPDLESFYFIDDLGGFTVLFLSDHASHAEQWCTHVQDRRHWNPSAYPYTAADYRAVMDEIQQVEKPVITAAHYAYPGGCNPHPLYEWFLPIPDTVRLHVHGHAHVGLHTYRTISHVRDQSLPQTDLDGRPRQRFNAVEELPIPQVAAASLEDRKNGGSRSVLLETFEDGACQVFVRDHSGRNWLESYRIEPAVPAGDSAIASGDPYPGRERWNESGAPEFDRP